MNVYVIAFGAVQVAVKIFSSGMHNLKWDGDVIVDINHRDSTPMNEKSNEFYSLNDEESLQPRSKSKGKDRGNGNGKGKQRMSNFYLGDKYDETLEDLEDSFFNASTSANNRHHSTTTNSPLRPIGSEDSIQQLKTHAENFVSHHSQRLSETATTTTPNNSSPSASTTTSSDNISNFSNAWANAKAHMNLGGRNSFVSVDSEDGEGRLPRPVTALGETSILGNLLDLYAHKIVGQRVLADGAPAEAEAEAGVAPLPSPPQGNISGNVPRNDSPAAPEQVKIPMTSLNRQSNQETVRSTPSHSSIPAVRSRSNSLPDETGVAASYPPRPSPGRDARRTSQPPRPSFNINSPLTPVDENVPARNKPNLNIEVNRNRSMDLSRNRSMDIERNRSRSNSAESTKSYTSVNHLLKSFPNHSNFHGGAEYDDDDEASPDDLAENHPIKKLISPRMSTESGPRDTYPLLGGEKEANDPKRPSDPFEDELVKKISDSLQRHDFLLRLGKALMDYGAPTHRIESQLYTAADFLNVSASFLYLPNILMITLSDYDTHTCEQFFLRSTGGLDLSRLSKAHKVYVEVINKKINTEQALWRLHDIAECEDQYTARQTVLIGALASAAVAPMAFSASLADIPVVFFLGGFLTFVKVSGVLKSESFGFILEISCACLISMAARGLFTTGVFCFQSIAASAIVLILPGWIIACGALELASRNIVSGSIRVVYALCYSMFLGFAISIGSDFISVLAVHDNSDQHDQFDTVTLSGTFLPNSSFSDINNPIEEGSFTFTNTSAPTYHGDVVCVRHPDAPFYLKTMPKIYLLVCAPVFAAFLSMYNKADWRKSEMWIGVIISCSGYASNVATTMFAPNRSDIISSVSSFTVGFLGNCYSRLFKRSAFPVTVTGILLCVPNGISAAGGIAMSNPSPDNESSFSRGLVIGLRMFQVAVGIVVGLFLSTIFVYNIGAKRGFLFSF
ncbi:hypothetical protein E3P91_01854 [Wallemia ichthyophaga]|nr:hypothetical protein E3P91_01854 [Wallemia ichthyophaga]TIB63039.1 hypothetical protein E3P78_02060 [Wallemia ichthyophaga]